MINKTKTALFAIIIAATFAAAPSARAAILDWSISQSFLNSWIDHNFGSWLGGPTLANIFNAYPSDVFEAHFYLIKDTNDEAANKLYFYADDSYTSKDLSAPLNVAEDLGDYIYDSRFVNLDNFDPAQEKWEIDLPESMVNALTISVLAVFHFDVDYPHDDFNGLWMISSLVTFQIVVENGKYSLGADDSPSHVFKVGDYVPYVIPEPTTGTLALAGLALLLRRRRRNC